MARMFARRLSPSDCSIRGQGEGRLLQALVRLWQENGHQGSISVDAFEID